MVAWPDRKACARCSMSFMKAQEGTGAFLQSLHITPAHGLPTARKVHPDELEVRAGPSPTAHGPEPDGHHAGARHQPLEPDHRPNPQAD